MSGVYSSLTGHRSIELMSPRSRRRCWCCGGRATHYGAVDGAGMMSGCEWLVRSWVRDPDILVRLLALDRGTGEETR